MKERRSLIEGVKSSGDVDPAVEREYVFGTKPQSGRPRQPHDPKAVAEVREGKGQVGNSPSRVPLTTRVRADYAMALKRASLERQLSGVTPNTLQDILEEALEPWLRTHGHLT
jgi:hypothetical protein